MAETDNSIILLTGARMLPNFMFSHDLVIQFRMSLIILQTNRTLQRFIVLMDSMTIGPCRTKTVNI